MVLIEFNATQLETTQLETHVFVHCTTIAYWPFAKSTLQVICTSSLQRTFFVVHEIYLTY